MCLFTCVSYNLVQYSYVLYEHNFYLSDGPIYIETDLKYTNYRLVKQVKRMEIFEIILFI